MIIDVPVSSSEHDGFDVIGDVHGCYNQLVELLHRLGYSDESGAYRHSSRQVVFVGDLIDRGPGQVDVLRLVRAMADAGTALVVMGNHEFNAIAYATPNPDQPGEYLRRHSEKNNSQHAEFLAQIGGGSADHVDVVKWFTTLPLWLDLGDLRVVHACWEPSAMTGLGTPYLDEQLLVAASTSGNDVYQWVEHLCKGPEVRLPAGHTFHDKEGNRRTEARLRWWDAKPLTYASACEVPPNCTPPLPDTTIQDLPVDLYNHDVPVIFGHYWRDWPSIELTNTTACVDYSAVKGGPLVAYRWSGETTLTVEHLVAAGQRPIRWPTIHEL